MRQAKCFSRGLQVKIAIIGGAGFIGVNLCETLLEQGHSVNVFVRSSNTQFPSPKTKTQATRFEGDFLNQDDLSAAIQGCEMVFHLVSTTLPKTSNENPGSDVNENVIGSIRLMEVARTCGVRRIIFISSGGTVYGRPKYLPIDENHPTDPICSYGITKLMTEKYLALYHELHGLDYIILRLSNPFGKYQRTAASQGAVAVFFGKILRDECIDIWGDGSVMRDYIYIGDVMNAMIAAIEYNGNERLFNIGSGEGKTLLEILETIEHVTDHRVKHRFLKKRGFDVPVNVLSIERAKVELGWSPKTKFDEGLLKTHRWLVKQVIH